MSLLFALIFLVAFIASPVDARDSNEKSSNTPAEDVSSSPLSQTSVGQVGRLSQVILPGSRLQARPIDDRQLPIIVRITDTWPHGTDFRYDIEFMGLEPGEFDLRDFLVRLDGSSTADLNPLMITVQSVLPAGHIPPNSLVPTFPRLGSYRFWMWLAAVAWVAGLIWIIFYPARATANQAEQEASPITLAELLEPRLKKAAAGELNSQQLAELERYIVEYWRRKLEWDQIDWTTALPQLRRHETAGPLLQQVEKWLHAPQSEKKVDLNHLLEPYQRELVNS